MVTMKPIRKLTETDLLYQLGVPSANPAFTCPIVDEGDTEPCGMRLRYYNNIEGGPVCATHRMLFDADWSTR